MNQFFKFYISDDQSLAKADESMGGIYSLEEFLISYGGQSFNNSIYRLFDLDLAKEWQERILPNYLFSGQINFFGYDWMGRIFAQYINTDAVESVLLFSQQSMGVFEIPSSWKAFHNEILIEEKEPALEYSLWEAWHTNKNNIITKENCVGLSNYLFSGGELIKENLSITDMAVDWELATQLFRKMNSLDEHDPVYEIVD